MKLASSVLLLLLAPHAVRSKWLIVSSPKTGLIHYSKILTATAKASRQPMVLQKLTGTGMVTKPEGMAVDDIRSILYVADAGAKSIVGMRLVKVANGSGYDLAAEPSRAIVIGDNFEPHWVAVDSLGTVFFTDLTGNQIWSVPADIAMARINQGASPVFLAKSSTATTLLYSGLTLVDSLKNPQGVAVDNFNIFWANGDSGSTMGTICQGREDPPEQQAMRDAQVTKVTSAANQAFGVCLASSRIFYTEDAKVYTTLKKGGGTNPTLVADRLLKPRGIQYDGDGTIYVADMELGKVLSFSVGVSTRLHMRTLTPELTVEDAYGLAVFRGGAAQVSSLFGVLLSLLSVASV